MQTISYLHLLSPAMHPSVAVTRQHHLTEATRLETEIDLLTHEGHGLVRAKDPQLSAKGRRCLAKAEAKREVLRAHLIEATDLTDYAEREPEPAWYSRALSAASEAASSFHSSAADKPNPIYARQPNFKFASEEYKKRLPPQQKANGKFRAA